MLTNIHIYTFSYSFKPLNQNLSSSQRIQVLHPLLFRPTFKYGKSTISQKKVLMHSSSILLHKPNEDYYIDHYHLQ